jgi:hypothetical protein
MTQKSKTETKTKIEEIFVYFPNEKEKGNTYCRQLNKFCFSLYFHSILTAA